MELLHMIDLLINNPKYIWAIVSLLGLIAIVISFIRAHFSNNDFDLMKLMVFDSKGKMSDSKARLNGAFLITSWAFVFLTMNDKLTEWYVAVFLAAWVGDRFAARKANQVKDADETNTDK
jgi:hypothetical protein